MEISIKFNNSYARSAEYYLRRRYTSKASLEKLAKVAITELVAEEAKRELAESYPEFSITENTITQ